MQSKMSSPEVALLAEGVDRNRLIVVIENAAVVALLAEGVDRNSSRNHSFQIFA